MMTNESHDQLYVYRWGNTARRSALKGRVCRVLSWTGHNQATVEFLDGGEVEIVPRMALV